MHRTLVLTRVFFFILSIFFMMTYLLAYPSDTPWVNGVLGACAGIALGSFLICFDLFLKRFSLRSFNVIAVGLFFGYLMSTALNLIFETIVNSSALSFHLPLIVLEIIKIGLFLFGTYLGTVMTLRNAEELSVSIPFVRFYAATQRKKDVLLDVSCLSDARIIDLASSGLLDNQVILPRFIIKDLHSQSQMSDDLMQVKAKKSLETLQKLESFSTLQLRYNDTDFPDIADPQTKMVRLARLLDANILTMEGHRTSLPTAEGLRMINLNILSHALKPVTLSGELIKIKVQRYGKEARQGVGYLEDGTMVVINGGGEFIGETIEARVLSVKHTSSGRMIFCNALDDMATSPLYHDEP